MNKTFHQTLLYVLILYTIDVLGNGGPVDGAALYKAGTITFHNIPSVQLVKEDLRFYIEGDSISVRVEYTFANHENIYEEIDYTYPIDVLYDMYKSTPQKPTFTFNGNPLSVSVHSKVEKRYSGVDRWWYTASFVIPPNQSATLMIEHKLSAGFTDGDTNKDALDSYDHRRFIYDFAPAAHWGNGIIDTFNIVANARDIMDKYGSSISFEGLSFHENDGIYTYSKNYFDIQTVDQLTIDYDYSRYLQEYPNVLKCINSEIRDISTVRASSKLKGDYAPENVLDHKLSTAWVEGVDGFGKDEWIEIEFEDSISLNAIIVIPGYTKSKKVYDGNNRVKKLSVEMFGNHLSYFTGKHVEWNPDTFSSEFDDAAFIPYNKADDGKNLPHYVVFRQYSSEKQDVFPQNSVNITRYCPKVFFWDMYNQGDMPVPLSIKKIRFYIKDVYEGTKYDDTCISEILFFEQELNKDKLEPYR